MSTRCVLAAPHSRERGKPQVKTTQHKSPPYLCTGTNEGKEIEHETLTVVHIRDHAPQSRRFSPGPPCLLPPLAAYCSVSCRGIDDVIAQIYLIITYPVDLHRPRPTAILRALRAAYVALSAYSVLHIIDIRIDSTPAFFSILHTKVV